MVETVEYSEDFKVRSFALACQNFCLEGIFAFSIHVVAMFKYARSKNCLFRLFL
jgi:hypothetical protein